LKYKAIFDERSGIAFKNTMALKVLHLSSERSWRGGEQQIAYLLEESLKCGVEVYVAVKRGSEFEKYCQQKNLNFFPLPFSNSTDLKTANAIRKICKTIHADIIHMHSAKSHGIGVLSAILGTKVPLVLSRRVDFVPKSSWLTKFKYNHGSIRRIICVSEKINEIIRNYIKNPEKSITIHSGIDTQKFKDRPVDNILRKEYSLPKPTFLIGNTSALEAHKDYLTFIKTIEILHQQKADVRAFIIGSGSLENELKSVVQARGLSDTIFFTGFRKDIQQVLTSLDLFLMTSNEEGLGTSVLDAFAAGIPVVATRAGGIPEMVVDRHTGMLAPIADADALAKAVEELMTNNILAHQLTANATKKLNEEFTKEITAKKTLSVYRQVLGTPDYLNQRITYIL
jgi:L-malate glycosyltransferase